MSATTLAPLQMSALGKLPSVSARASPRATASSSNSLMMPPMSPIPAAPARAGVMTHWLRYKLLSNDRVERHFAFLIAMLVSASVLFALMKPTGPVFLWGSPMCSLWAAALAAATLGGVWAEQRERWLLFELARFAQFLLTMLSVLIYYDGSNVINRFRYASRGDSMLYDETLLKMDEAIWGWLWPRGQMALWLDTQPTFGVTTFIGRCYAELFQILYVSYYFWGNAIGVVLAFNYFYFAVYKKSRGSRKRVQWRTIQMFVSAWVGAFVLNHLINLCFPAVSPRIYLAASYKNELKGLWILASMRNAITNAAANTFSAFPSGHCGLSILAVLLAFRIQLSRVYTWCVLVSTVLIILATQVLRYHYFVDFFFSSSVVLFGAWLGGFHDGELYNKCLKERGLEDTDEEGKWLDDEYVAAAAAEYEALPLMDLNGSMATPLASTAGGDAHKGAAAQQSVHHATDDEELGGGLHDGDAALSGGSRSGTSTPPLDLSAAFGTTSSSAASASSASAKEGNRAGISRAISSQKIAALKAAASVGDGGDEAV